MPINLGALDRYENRAWSDLARVKNYAAHATAVHLAVNGKRLDSVE